MCLSFGDRHSLFSHTQPRHYVSISSPFLQTHGARSCPAARDQCRCSASGTCQRTALHNADKVQWVEARPSLHVVDSPGPEPRVVPLQPCLVHHDVAPSGGRKLIQTAVTTNLAANLSEAFSLMGFGVSAASSPCSPPSTVIRPPAIEDDDATKIHKFSSPNGRML